MVAYSQDNRPGPDPGIGCFGGIPVIESTSTGVHSPGCFCRRLPGGAIRFQVELAVLDCGKSPGLKNNPSDRVGEIITFHPIENHRRYGNLSFEWFAPGFPIDYLCQQAQVPVRDPDVERAGLALREAVVFPLGMMMICPGRIKAGFFRPLLLMISP